MIFVVRVVVDGSEHLFMPSTECVRLFIKVVDCGLVQLSE